MSMNSTLTVNSSAATTQVSKTTSKETTKKTDSSFKDEMDKVSTNEKNEVTENAETKAETKVETKETEKTKEPEKTDKAAETKPEAKTEQVSQKEETKDMKAAADNKATEKAENVKNKNEQNNTAQLDMQQMKAQQLNKQQLNAQQLNAQQLNAQQLNAQQLNAQQLNAQQNPFLNEKNKISEVQAKKTETTARTKKKSNQLDSLNPEDELAGQIAETIQNQQVDNNYNADSVKSDENTILNGNVIFNNALSSFDINNTELSNDIQQMISTSNIAQTTSAIKSMSTVGSMKLNSGKNISMTKSDADFFVNLTQNNNGDVSVQNMTAQAAEMTQKGANVKEVKQNVQVSQALLDALSESREKNQPLRIDFDRDVSVILRVSKEGTLAANFIPGDKAVEQYLKNNIETLKTTFNENDLPYSDLTYSNRGGQRQKENQRDRQQQQRQ